MQCHINFYNPRMGLLIFRTNVKGLSSPAKNVTVKTELCRRKNQIEKSDKSVQGAIGPLR